MWQNAPAGTNEEILCLVQQEVSRALSLSVEAVTQEPLPEEIVLLLLRLALAESLKSSMASVAERRTDSLLSIGICQ